MKTKYLFFLAGIIIVGVIGILLYSPPKTRVPQEVPTTPTDEQTPPGPENANIHVTAPESGQVITSPLSLQGEAKGNWYFEASFPVKIVDASGMVLAEVPVQAKGDWMTTNFVPFDQTVAFQNPTTATGFVIFQKDNPSGLPENEDEIKIPVRFDPNTLTAKEMSVSVYFGNSKKIQPGQDECTTVYGVERKVAFTVATARTALEELLKGPTDAEKKEGYSTTLNSEVKIQSLSIENGVAKVDFDKKLEEGVGGSCRVLAIRTQINQTLKQFSTVHSVIISIDGRTEDILQP